MATTPVSATATATAAVAPPQPAAAEVVGASGRMGTFYLQRHRAVFGGSGAAIAASSSLPGRDRRLSSSSGPPPAIGASTREGNPIYVATPSGAYDEIYETTPLNRRSDLVLVGNAGLPIGEKFRNSTVLVPHFSVLYRNQWRDNNGNANSSDGDDGDTDAIRVDTDPEVSPPTYIYGKHAETVSKLLNGSGISTEIVDSFPQIEAYSGRKLLWASCFWLLCHSQLNDDDNGDERAAAAVVCPDHLPLTVGGVHEASQNELERLVDEILPSLRDWLGLSAAAATVIDDDSDRGKDDREEEEEEEEEQQQQQQQQQEAIRVVERIVERSAVLDYLRAYSESIFHAVPSVELAKREFLDRNAVWLRKKNQQQTQSFHTELLEKLGVNTTLI